VINWLFRNRHTGRITVAQVPNVALGIFVACALARRLFDPRGDVLHLLRIAGTAALIWWAIDEIARGVNPWRRILGTVVLVTTLVGLFTT
jgi:hypothetical protein